MPQLRSHYLVAALTFAGFAAAPALAQQLGNRLVLAINQVPYSQRQIELYTAVRVALFAPADQTGTLVDSANWNASLALFTTEMVILQEAQRLGSFGTVDAVLEKYSARLQARRTAHGKFAMALQRLGADDPALAHTLENVLRVAAFRRSKNRQEAQDISAAGGATPTQPGGAAKWLSDLSGRAATRLYLGGDVYQTIQPVQRSLEGGP